MDSAQPLEAQTNFFTDSGLFTGFFSILVTHADRSESVGVGKMFGCVCLLVCLFVCMSAA